MYNNYTSIEVFNLKYFEVYLSFYKQLRSCVSQINQRQVKIPTLGSPCHDPEAPEESNFETASKVKLVCKFLTLNIRNVKILFCKAYFSR